MYSALVVMINSENIKTGWSSIIEMARPFKNRLSKKYI